MAEKIQLNKFKILAISIGIVYLWFGFLKFFPGLSPAEELAKDTIHYLTIGLIPPDLSLKLLAIWEVGIGLLLIFTPVRKVVITITLLHMFLTFTPFLFFPDMSFNKIKSRTWKDNNPKLSI